MTTINNLTIEQMREIVDGAPDWTKAYKTKMKQYTNGFIRCSSDIYFDDLRTAIAKHDTTNHVTEIRNHFSPSTIIKDLESERHG